MDSLVVRLAFRAFDDAVLPISELFGVESADIELFVSTKARVNATLDVLSVSKALFSNNLGTRILPFSPVIKCNL